jgi:hypothetical protein
MLELLDKLDIRTTDYVAVASNVDSGPFNTIKDTVKGVVSFGNCAFQGQGVRAVGSVKDLDRDAFDKIIAYYDEGLRVKDLIKASDHFGLVLVKNFPKDKRGILFRVALKKKGIFEVWELENRKSGTLDLLFRVRKYGENV